MAEYKITSELGKAFAEALNAGSSGTASDGSVWTKNADGSISVTHNGQQMNGVISSAPSASSNASASQSYTPTKKTTVVKPSTVKLNGANTNVLISDTGGGLTKKDTAARTAKQEQVAQQQAAKREAQKAGLNALATSTAQLGTAVTKENTQTLFEQATKVKEARDYGKQVLTSATGSLVSPVIQQSVQNDLQEAEIARQQRKERIALQQAQEEAINSEATATMNQIGKYRAMPTLAETAAKSFAGGAIDSARGFVNNLGYAAQGAVRDQLTQQIGDAIARGDYAEAERLRETLNGFSETKDIATFGQTFDRQLATRRQNENGLYKVVNDVSAGVGGMIPSILASLATQGVAGAAGATQAITQAAANTASLFVMASGAAGNATREALNAGASNEKAIIYGGAVGAVEILTEKLAGIGGFATNKIFGKSISGDMVENAIRNAVKNESAQAAVLFLADALGEGAEEFASEFADWALNKWLVKSDNREALETLGDAGYSFMIGAFTAAVMNTTSKIPGKSVKEIAKTVTQETERVLDAEIENAKPINQAMLSTMQGQEVQEQTAPVQQTQETAVDRAMLDTLRQNEQAQEVAALVPSMVQEDTAPIEQQRQASMNQPVNAEDSTGAAPYGFDPLSNATNQYGAIPPGENPARVIDLPTSTDGETKVHRFARTAAEAPVTTDEAVQNIENLVASGELSYEVYGDKAAIADAEQYIKSEIGSGKDIEAVRRKFINDVSDGKSSKLLSATGSLLFADASSRGDLQATMDILDAMSTLEGRSAQTVQAARLLKQLSPAYQLSYIQKQLDKLNSEIQKKSKKKFGKKIELPSEKKIKKKFGKDIVLPSELVQEFLDARDNAARDAVIDKMQQSVADQMPSTFLEVWNAVRFNNMLGNLKTQVRNIGGNIFGQVLRETKNVSNYAIENIASLASKGKTERRTDLFPGKARMQAAAQTFSAYEDVVLGEAKFKENNAKDPFMKGVQERRRKQVFTNTGSNLLNKIGVVEQVYSNLIDKAMNEYGDKPFSKFGFTRTLAGWMKANGITAEQWSNQKWQKANAALAEKGLRYAIQEAQEATYRDTNTLSKWFSELGRGKNKPWYVRVGAEGISPFRKTPANVLVTMIKYSPAGFLLDTAPNAVKAINGIGDVTGTDVINSVSRAFTGSALMVLGMALHNAGKLRGKADEQDELEGRQSYSLEIGDQSITIDWANPLAWPMLLGAQIEQFRQENGIELKDLQKAILSVADPLLEMSFLSSAKDLLEEVSDSDNSLGELAVKLALSYLSQVLTNTLLGQIEQSTEKYSMQTYVDPDSPLPDWLQKELGKASRKIPGWDFQQIPYVDRWGRAEETGNFGERAFNAFLNPAYTSTINQTDVDRELRRLEEETGNNYQPGYATKTISAKDANGKTLKIALTGEQYNQYRTVMGQANFSIRNEVLSNPSYEKLPSAIKGKITELIDDYSRQVAKDSLGIEGISGDKWIRDLNGASLSEVVNTIIGKAVESVGGIASDEEIENETKLIPDIPAKAKALDYAKKYAEYKAEQEIGFGDATDWILEADELNAEERANYFTRKALSEYWKDNPLTETEDYKKSERLFSDPVYTGISDGLKEKAGETLKEYIRQTELAKYGKEPEDWVLEAQSMSDKERAQYFIDKAINAAVGKSGDDEPKWDTAKRLYDAGEINDAAVLSLLPSDAVDAYEKWGKDAGVTAQTWVDVLSFHNSDAAKTEHDDDGNETVTAKEKLEKWLSEKNLTEEQRQAVMRAFYKDTQAEYAYLSEAVRNGTVSAEDAKKQLTPAQQTGWSKNVKDTGANIADYIDAVNTFLESPSEAERKAAGYKTKWEWFVAELNKTELSKEQKYAIAVSMDNYAESTKEKIYNKLR